MKKAILIANLLILPVVCAITTEDLKQQLENSYSFWVKSWLNEFNLYSSKVEEIEKKLATGDYAILLLFTWININTLKDNIKTSYKDYIEKITSKKYNILSEIEVTKTNFDNGIISTWEFEASLNDLQVQISWYQAFVGNSLDQLKSSLSGLYESFNDNLQKTLSEYSDAIKKYKAYKNELKDINAKFEELKNQYKKLTNSIWIAKKTIETKKEELREFVNNYYSELLDKKFKKYLKEDPNFAYFKTWFDTKKKILLWFIDNNLEKAFDEIITNYYPDVDIDSLEWEIKDANNKNPDVVVKNYNSIMTWFKSLKNTLEEYLQKVNEKLAKFKKWEKETILEVIEKDLIAVLDNITKVIQDDIAETFKWWKIFIETRKQIEKQLLEKVTENYINAIQTDTLTGYQDFLDLVDAYSDTIILPENKKVVENYRKVIESKLELLKIRIIKEKIREISKKINNLPLRDFEALQLIKKQIETLMDNKNLPEEILKELKKLKLQVLLKENLHKLYKSWAISFYYSYGDLTDTVVKLLKKYYEKYKAEWKEDIFLQKVHKACEKIKILETSLTNDLRSYYIIMIYNGLLKFKFDLWIN